MAAWRPAADAGGAGRGGAHPRQAEPPLHRRAEGRAVLALENIPDCLATATVRVRIGAKLFNDRFVMHKVDGRGLIATKASCIVRTFD